MASREFSGLPPQRPPAPARRFICWIAPSPTPKGGPGFTLTIKGTGFVQDSVARWNGANRATTFVSSTRLTAAIPPGDIAAPGSALVTVFNPTLGGTTANPATFTIETPA